MTGFLFSTNRSLGSIEFSNDTHTGTNYSDYDGSLVKTHVDAYKNKLVDMGLDSTTDVTIITVEEIEALGCTNRSCSSAPEFIYSTSYWTRDAYGNNRIIAVYSNHDYYDIYYSTNISYGIRPVLTINQSEL